MGKGLSALKVPLKTSKAKTFANVIKAAEKKIKTTADELAKVPASISCAITQGC